jgi:CubicO group peptidase (beta-lactamase class C family)
MDNKIGFKNALPLIDDWIKFQIFIKEIPGAAIGIFVEDEIIFNKVYGYANLENQVKLTSQHLFRIASQSKLFTATAIMKLYYENKISLDDQVLKHLSWFTSDNDDNLQNICIHHLLTHTSGITCDGNTAHWTEHVSPNLEKIIQQVKEGVSVFKTSETVKYSNLGYVVLGQIIEAVTGQSYEEYIQETILDPLGMTNTVIDVEQGNIARHATGYGMKLPKQPRIPVDHFPAGIMQAAAGLSSTVEDLIKFYQAQMYGNDILLPDHIKREMQRVQVSYNKDRWGLGFEIANYPNGETVVCHSGGYPGFKSLSGLDQEDKVILVVLTNVADGPNYTWFNGITTLLSRIVKCGECRPQEEDVPDFNDLTGYYASESYFALICQVGSQLVLISPESDDPASTLQILKHHKDHTFITPGGHPFTSPGEKISFIDGPEGEKMLIDHHGGKIKKFKIS